MDLAAPSEDLSDGEDRRKQRKMSEGRMGAGGFAYVICGVDDIKNRRAKVFQLMRIEADGEERPWIIFIVRWDKQVFGYVNSCPHQGTHLDWERNQFFDGEGKRLLCGKHGAAFEVATGLCIEGPCLGRSLEPIPISVIDGDICVTGVALLEEGEVVEMEQDAP
jgi:nitrite reductase/ring-hydroxylating ferredoxin subunit